LLFGIVDLVEASFEHTTLSFQVISLTNESRLKRRKEEQRITYKERDRQKQKW